MNFLKLFLFIIHVYLETSIFPKYLSNVINSNNMLYASLLIGGYLSIFTLRKFSRIFVFTILMADLVFVIYLIQTFYNPMLTFGNSALALFIYGLISFIILYGNNLENYTQYKNSENLKTFSIFLLNLICSYTFFYHFKGIHFKTVKQIEKIDNLNLKQITINMGVDFLVFFHIVVVMNLLRMKYSKSKKSFYFMSLIKRAILLVLMTIIFYANYNNFLNNLIYHKFNEIVHQPHNVVAYNMMPLDPDMRFRLVITSLLYLIL